MIVNFNIQRMDFVSNFRQSLPLPKNINMVLQCFPFEFDKQLRLVDLCGKTSVGRSGVMLSPLGGFKQMQQLLKRSQRST